MRLWPTQRRGWAKATGIAVDGLGVHGVRATAATTALEHRADIAKVQAWLGHVNISTTRLYDRRGERTEVRPPTRSNIDAWRRAQPHSACGR
ncbi:hypothetical protein DA83_25200 [Pseudomonas sp. 250J]|nr:hypothetical protein DA83_25200 [Pseudomonas sp. 250J]